MWDAGYTGKGVDVAVIDSGVVPVDGLAGSGKVVYGPDLTLENGTARPRTSTPTVTARTWPASSPARDSAAEHVQRERHRLRRHGSRLPDRQHQGR